MKSIQLEIVANDPSLPKTKGFSNNILRELRKTLNCDFTVYKEMIAEYLATKFAISSTDAFDAYTTVSNSIKNNTAISITTTATNGTVTDFAANIIPTINFTDAAITNEIVNPNNVTIDAMDYDNSATV